MKTVILATDRCKETGELSELTRNIPKALMLVAGRPLLSRILRSLSRSGIREAIIVTGYRGELIRQVVGDVFAGIKIKYVENLMWEQGDLHSFLTVEKEIHGDFLLCVADNLFDHRIVEGLVQHGLRGVVTLAVDDVDPLPGAVKGLVENGRIIDIGEEIDGSNHVYVGVLLCSSEVFKYARKAVNDGGKTLIDCIKLIARDGKAYAFDLDTVPSYLPKMRRHERPFWISIETLDDLKHAERLLVENASKEPSDLVAKYLNKPIENRLVLILAKTSITPNQVTIIVNITAYLVTYLFLTGQLLIGSILTFLVGILDGVDGKLARIHGMESKLGIMEHPFDLLFEFSWYIALALHSFWTLRRADPLILCLFILAAIAFYRFIYDQFRKATGMSLDDYGKFERYFRRVAGRRNLYNIPILISTLFNAPFYALIAISCHAVLTAFIYAWRACKHLYKLDLTDKE